MGPDPGALLLEFARVTILRGVLLFLAIAVAFPYLWAPVYRFPAPHLFSGSALWNPYAQLHGRWQLANLHAHGRSWSGLTNGRQSDADVVRAYRERGYAVAGLSDYQRLAGHGGIAAIPIYEHGYNISKYHQLAIGARRIEWLDFPFWQGPNQQQYVLDRVKQSAELVAIAHPRSAYTAADLQALTGYQLLEVVNGHFIAEDLWDAALSSGHAVWIVANDDTHDVTDPQRMAVAWNMIDAPSGDTRDVIAALAAGRAYAVSEIPEHKDGIDAVLTSVEVRDDTLVVSSAGTPATIVFIGQGGAVRKTVEQATTAGYTMMPQDSYIRVVIRTPNTVMYLNPVIRYDGVGLASPVATRDGNATWLQRTVIALGCVALVPVLWRRRTMTAPTSRSGAA